MDCSSTRITEMLPDYFSGHLSDDDLSLVETHLAGCRSCQERLSIMELLSDNSEHNRDAGSLAHIAPNLLASYYESKDSLKNATISEIDAHLKSCEKCTRELSFLRGLESDLLAIGQSVKRSPSFVTVIFRETWSAVRRPAFAYALIALMFYPTIDWLYSNKKSSHEVLSEKVFFLSEQTRSEGDIPIVIRGIEDPVTRLQVPFFHLSQEKRYEFVFTNLNADSIFVIEVISDLDQKGSIQLLANLRSLPNGSYLMNVVEIDKNDDEDRNKTSYPFKLETAAR